MSLLKFKWRFSLNLNQIFKHPYTQFKRPLFNMAYVPRSVSYDCANGTNFSNAFRCQCSTCQRYRTKDLKSTENEKPKDSTNKLITSNKSKDVGKDDNEKIQQTEIN